MGSQEMRSELRQRLGGKMRRDRVILQLCTELVSDLLIDCVDNFLTRKHGRNLPRIARIQTDEFCLVCSAPHRHPEADAAATTDHFRARNGLITWVEPY